MPGENSSPFSRDHAYSDGLLAVVGLLAALLVLAALAYPAFSGKFYTESDLAKFFIPVRKFYQDCLVSGDPFVWYPYQFSGYHLHGEGQAGLYHPLNLLFYRLLPYRVAFNAEFLRSYVFLLVGGLLFFVRTGLPVVAAILGSLAFAFSGFNLLHYMHLNVVGAAAHLPWLLLAVDVIVRSENPRLVSLATLGGVLLTASLLLMGHPQVVWMSVFIEALYAATLLMREGRLVSTVAVRLLAVQCLGLAAAAVQLLPLAESFASSVRAGTTDDFANTLALPPINLAQLVAPYVFHGRIVPPESAGGVSLFHTVELGIYCGALFPVVCVWLVLRWHSLGRWKPWVAASMTLVGLTLWLALGSEAGLYRLQLALPIVDGFRAPVRWILGTQFGVAALIAIAFSDWRGASLEQVRSVRLWPLFLPVAVSAAVSLILFVSKKGNEYSLGDFRALASGPALLAAAALLVSAAARKLPGALVVIVVFVVADLSVYGLTFISRDQPSDLEALAGTTKFADGDLEDLEGYRMAWARPIAALVGVRQAWGHVALWPDRQLQSVGPAADPLVLASWRVQSVRRSSPGGIGGPVDGLPRVRLVTEAVQVEDVRESILGMDLASTALVNEPVDLAAGVAGSARIAEERPGFIRIETEARGRQLLVISESFHEGWRAQTDGQVCHLVRAYGDLMGCVVGEGRHETVLRFEPTSLRRGIWLSWTGLALALVWVGLDLVRTRQGSG